MPTVELEQVANICRKRAVRTQITEKYDPSRGWARVAEVGSVRCGWRAVIGVRFIAGPLFPGLFFTGLSGARYTTTYSRAVEF